MWERNLQDLIRGLRANKKNESKYISQAIDEIRKEVKTKDMEVKAAAILKLTYVRVLYCWLRTEINIPIPMSSRC